MLGSLDHVTRQLIVHTRPTKVPLAEPRISALRLPAEGAQGAHSGGLPGFQPDQTALQTAHSPGHSAHRPAQSAHQSAQPKAAENSQNVHPVHPVRSVRRSPEKTAETEVVFGDGLASPKSFRASLILA
jgi:hypothetical protein